MMKKVMFVCLAMALMVASAVALAAPAAAINGTIPVTVDIRPTSDVNPFNPKARGVLPVAILGTADFDVTTVDPTSVVLTWPCGPHPDDSVPPLRWAYEDVSADGWLDLVLKFRSREVAAMNLASLDPGARAMLELTGNLKEEDGGVAIAGEDMVIITPVAYNH